VSGTLIFVAVQVFTLGFGVLLGVILVKIALRIAERRARRRVEAIVSGVSLALKVAAAGSERQSVADYLNNLPMSERVKSPDGAEDRTMTGGDNPE
jgi:uncharacterized membrane protein